MIREAYWRSSQLWYRFKCWAWKRYPTVKPRYLGHTWVDRSELMPHMMFEILCQFVERECSPGHIEWYGEHGHKVGDKYVMDEMKELVAWWKETWNKEYEEVNDMLWAEAYKHDPVSEFQEMENGRCLWDPQFETEADKEVWHRCVHACNKLDTTMHAALYARLHRIIPLIPSMWT